MGNIAARAICKGRIVDYCNLDKTASRENICRFDYKLLDGLGYGKLLLQLLDGQQLAHDQVVSLLTDTPLAVLMKLIHICCRSGGYRAPIPVVSLPVQRWLRVFGLAKATDLTLAYLEGIQAKKIVFVVNHLDFALLEDGLKELLATLTRCISDIQLVGPSPDELVSWLAKANPGQAIDYYVNKGSHYLANLRQLGFSSFRPVFREDSIALLESAGFDNAIFRTYIDQLTPWQLANELIRIGAFIEAGHRIHTWSPGVSFNRAGILTFEQTDLQLLRVLAVGSIYLSKISFRRVSTRYFSLPAIEFASYCGANDFGFGACDEVTANELQLSTIEKLEEVCKEQLRAT